MWLVGLPSAQTEWLEQMTHTHTNHKYVLLANVSVRREDNTGSMLFQFLLRDDGQLAIHITDDATKRFCFSLTQDEMRILSTVCEALSGWGQ